MPNSGGETKSKRAIRIASPPSVDRFRLFIAIPVPEAIKDEIKKAQDELRAALPKGAVRWAGRDQFHLTLRFLGSVEVQHLDRLATEVRRACESFRAVRLRAEGIGFFPNLRSPRVIWVSIRDHNGELVRLHTAIDEAVREFTAEKAEKDFTPHITLGRIKEIQKHDAKTIGQLSRLMMNRVFGLWTADRIQIIRSELSSGGSRYIVVSEVRLLDFA
jgi:2'-5' RNA ligase